ncbi:MAG TPA: hypothetical protein VIF62_04120 [Labilithrix sp.]
MKHLPRQSLRISSATTSVAQTCRQTTSPSAWSKHVQLVSSVLAHAPRMTSKLGPSRTRAMIASRSQRTRSTAPASASELPTSIV